MDDRRFPKMIPWEQQNTATFRQAVGRDLRPETSQEVRAATEELLAKALAGPEPFVLDPEDPLSVFLDDMINQLLFGDLDEIPLNILGDYFSFRDYARLAAEDGGIDREIEVRNGAAAVLIDAMRRHPAIQHVRLALAESQRLRAPAILPCAEPDRKNDQ